MNNAKARKLQYLLITSLLESGTVELLLPDGIMLEIGITQENKEGDLVKADDYCYVVATKDRKTAILDSYNLGLQFEKTEDTIVYEGETTDRNGCTISVLDIV
jgi:hypothetical protein